ncbi:TauD/TfdA dioxygenase family protein [Xenorhabdus innexi]|uniref:Alpha-ketoglutarate-dependent 2,4-dichlorophenoxyacetate dioxygenase clavaminate synthase-like domain protein n=1 Tax=Xenorhabdus innexi TaxID=290109 RepID=A0A1N6MXV0_9GAMM|nr:TauD/TfdA family dioxygenase [Xenorhabdus innexi]PHM33230.1 alpha-ketoglutarate-dependent 2,4-dichlorophenoxyacetate dioxygenase clavaminate synthase-like domain protein [Xenorhabdus innexi]SIP73607.1 putative alpha-ketoglutarate-dependent 2,4-dichlorophenoxyacetate dioxygenase [Xenorhabdus innexi]
MTFELKLVKEHYGAYVNCEDVSKLSSDDCVKLKEYLSVFGLLIFSNQKMDDRSLVNFARQIGNGKLEEPARKISLSEHRKHIAYLTNLNDNNGSPLGFSGSDTDYWHSDQEFRINPASISILHGVVTQCNGGNTSFASTSVDYLGLSTDEISLLNKLWSTRQPAVSHDNAPHITVAHPVIIKNEKTEKEYIYVSENTIEFIDNGNPLTNSDKVKEEILQRILSTENIYSHVWSDGDLILYDNSQLLHRRECFNGDRFIKALKIYPDDCYQIKIPGREIEENSYVS